MPRARTARPAASDGFTADGAFRIRAFAQKKPFANFLPGIAGPWGTPMWVFTVNRGQAVASFGTRDRDGAILEFLPANKAFQLVPRVGFRTFLKWKPAGAPAAHFAFHEPFAPAAAGADDPERWMDVLAHELRIGESAAAPALDTDVTYFTLPGEPLAALVRRVTVTNRSRRAVDLEVLDGLPQILPCGMNEFLAKQMSRTIEAWMTVDNARRRAPFFHLKVDPADRPEVVPVDGGHFYAAFVESDRPAPLLDVVVDPAALFGPALDFSVPHAFLAPGAFAVPAAQIRENRTPCAFAFARLRLAAGASATITSLAGRAPDVAALDGLLGRARGAGWVAARREENRRLVDGIRSAAFTVSALPVYDAYCGQTYLDNVLRGGMPACLGTPEHPLVHYVYSRKHGDLERDYNRFLLEDTRFSQGDGNYRDVNQNRRNDVWFEPRVGDANVRTFLGLLQLDGFNPLVVRGAAFVCRDAAAVRAVLARHLGREHAAEAAAWLAQPFTPGDLLRRLEARHRTGRDAFRRLLADLAPHLAKQARAEHGEGFWVDHWTYNLDLIESFLAIHPEKLADLLVGRRDLPFFENAHRVRPRAERFRRLADGRVRQYAAVLHDAEKERRLAARGDDGRWVRTQHGAGPVLRVSLLTKLVCLFVNKLASLDAQGIGIEMEADKPGWYDALNGLPGLAGSSVPEAFELERLAGLLPEWLDALPGETAAALPLPVELHAFVVAMDALLAASQRRGFVADAARFHAAAATHKEAFRAATADGVDGAERDLAIADLRAFLGRARAKLAAGLARSFDAATGLCRTYYRNEVVRSRRGDGDAVTPVAFRAEPLPYFLEGPVHALKVETDPARRRALYAAVRRSALFDAPLGMYKVNAALDAESLEIGRARVFAPGWLENESIWLHMEYKWLLEVLKAGLHAEFFRDLRRALVPFQPAERYGRSLLENSSFLASSRFPDPQLRGTGFVARLSGSTAEFLDMWLRMNVGARPFFLDAAGRVALRFAPVLPGWLFTDGETTRTRVDRDGREQTVTVPAGAFAFLFLGRTLVVYRNPERRDTFGRRGVAVRRIVLCDAAGREQEFAGDTLPAPYAVAVRDGVVPRLDIDLG